MATSSAVFDQDASVAGKNNILESVYKNLSLIDPYDAPFQQMAGEDTVGNPKFDFLVDALDAADPDNAIVEGADGTADEANIPKRYLNYTQIARKVAAVSGRLEASDKVGRKSEMKRLITNFTRQLIRDKEAALMQSEVYVAGTPSVASKTRGVPGFIYSNVDPVASGSTSGLGTGGTPGMGDPWDSNEAVVEGTTPRALTEALVNEQAELCYNNGGNPDILMIHPSHKKVVDTFAGETYSGADAATRFIQSEKTTRNVTFDVYKGPYGTLTIVPNRFQKSSQAFLLQSDVWDVVYLSGRKYAVEDLAKTGDSEKKQIISEFGLRCRNEKANGALHALTTP